jgi:FkbM family methyltransferase
MIAAQYRSEEQNVRPDGETFEVTMPSPNGVVRFLFGTQGNLDFIASLIRANGLARYEEPTPAVFVDLVQQLNGTVLDIGANTGLFALLAAAANPNVRIYGFEPLATIRELLQANIGFNPGLAPQIKIEPFGLSRTSGSLPFFETINDQGLITTSSSFELEHAQRIGQFCEHRIVTQTLDDWADTIENARVDLIKIDVEAHEHAVIEGGRKTISRHRPFIIVEILGAGKIGSINDMVMANSYLDFVLVPGTLRCCAEIRFHSDGWNHLLCPAEKASQVLSLCRQLGLRMEVS